jgi:hypothetical protein
LHHSAGGVTSAIHNCVGDHPTRDGWNKFDFVLPGNWLKSLPFYEGVAARQLIVSQIKIAVFILNLEHMFSKSRGRKTY